MSFKVVAIGWSSGCSRFLTGSTLADIDKDKNKNGLKEHYGGSGKFYAVTGAVIAVKAKASDLKQVIQYATNEKKLIYNLGYKLEKASVTVSAQTSYCGAKSYSKLSGPEKKEWDRFFSKLMKHEKCHYTDTLDIAKAMLTQLQQFSVEFSHGPYHTDVMSDQKKARNKAMKLFNKWRDKEFSSVRIRKRIEKQMKWRDAASNHGGSQGATLHY